jgi:hypothetical protein
VGTRASIDQAGLLTRLSVTYYEQKQYQKSLKCVVEALRVAPNCPLAIWDYAGTLDMLNRKKRAFKFTNGLSVWAKTELHSENAGRAYALRAH